MEKETHQSSQYSIEELLRSEEGVLTIGAARAVVMTEVAYLFLMKTLHEHAPHIIKYAFYDMGYRVGQSMMEGLRPSELSPEQAFRYLVETYKQAGYGNLQVLHFDLNGPEARLAGSNLFETSVATQSKIYRTPRTVDHYSRGMFAGFMSNLLGIEVICEEIDCEFRGDSQCVFVILPFERVATPGPLSAEAAQRPGA